MSVISDWLESTLGLDATQQLKIVSSVLAIIVILVVRRIVLGIVYKRQQDVTVRYRWRKSTSYTAFGILLIVVGSIWMSGFRSLSTYLGLLSAGVAIALRDPLVNLAGWAFIMWRKPFTVGDRIQIDSSRGDVIDQRIFMFSLMEIGNWVDADQSTGRMIHIPNGKIFLSVLANYSSGFQFIWHEIGVLVTFESNWRAAKEILTNTVNRHAEHLSSNAREEVKKAAERFMIFYGSLTPIVYTTVKDSGVMLTLRYLCAPRSRRTVEQTMWEEILDEFSKREDIDFAYPTQRFYNNRLEGKPEAKAE